METEQGKLPPPPHLFASLMAGFDSIANHIMVILPPVLLDLFLWLGPHLSLKQFVQPVIDSLTTLVSSSLIKMNASDVTSTQQMYTDFFNRFNLFAILRTFPVGATSLLSFEMPAQNPWGAARSISAGSFMGILDWAVLLIFVGWVFGALYYYWVATVSLKPEGRLLWRSMQQGVMLSLIWVGLLILFGLPALLLLSVMTVISPILGQAVLFIGAILLIWLVMPIFFSSHGIFSQQMNALHSILASLRMVRFTLPNTGLFLLMFLIINQGLNFLWSTPPLNSWWMLVGIVGHAFVSTALLASSFVYYRDINVWLKIVFDQLQRQTTSMKA
jgi:hypothetical protein